MDYDRNTVEAIAGKTGAQAAILSANARRLAQDGRAIQAELKWAALCRHNHHTNE